MCRINSCYHEALAAFCTLCVVLLQEARISLGVHSMIFCPKYPHLQKVQKFTSNVQSHFKGMMYLFLLKNSDNLRDIFITNIKPLTRCVFSCYSLVQLFETLWTTAHQAPLYMGLSPQEFYRGLPFLPPKDLADPGIKLVSPVSPSLQTDSLPLSHLGNPAD